jgi:hypothetical protein
MEWTETILLCTMILLNRARSAVVKTEEHTFALLHRLGLKNPESHTESSFQKRKKVLTCMTQKYPEFYKS